MLASRKASTCSARSLLRASTSALSRGQLANPYSRATASCAAARVIESATAPILAAAAGSPERASRSRSLAWCRSWPMSGRAGRFVMTSPCRPAVRVPGAKEIVTSSARKQRWTRSCPRTRRRPPAPAVTITRRRHVPPLQARPAGRLVCSRPAPTAARQRPVVADPLPAAHRRHGRPHAGGKPVRALSLACLAGDVEGDRGAGAREQEMVEPTDAEVGPFDGRAGVAAEVAAADQVRPYRGVQGALDPGESGGVGADVFEEAQQAAGLEHAVYLPQGRVVVGERAQHERDDGGVDAGVRRE